MATILSEKKDFISTFLNRFTEFYISINLNIVKNFIQKVTIKLRNNFCIDDIFIKKVIR